MSTLQRLEKLATAHKLELDGVPSASVALLEDGKITSSLIGNGDGDIDTVYQACSISKAITALAVAKLIDEGKFTYDTRVIDHLPTDTIGLMTEPWPTHLIQHVTVRMLLSHTSGLSQGGFPGYSQKPATAHEVLAGTAPANTPKVRFQSFPGAHWSYSGGGFTVLQMFLEQMIGRSFVEIMQDVVLRPLKMSRSQYGPLPAAETNYASAHFTAHVCADAEYHTFAELAAAGLWTTPADLLRAVSAVQESLHSTSGFLKKDTAFEMLTMAPQDSGDMFMALGWAADHSVFAHRGGNEPGYRCYVLGSHGGTVNPKAGAEASQLPPRRGVAVMTNSVEGFRAVQMIVGAIYYLQGWPRFETLPCGFGKPDFVPYAVSDGAIADAGWRQWVGQWEGGWCLKEDGGQPALAFEGFRPMRLLPAAMSVEPEEHSLVVEGLRVAVRLTFKSKERAIELVQPGGGKMLHRISRLC